MPPHLRCILAAILPLAALAQPTPTSTDPAHARSFVPSDYLNRALPGWIRLDAQERVRIEGFSSAGFQPDTEDAYVLYRLRVNLGLLPAAWLQFHFQMQDARVAAKNLKPYAPTFQDTLDLRLAYIQIGRSEPHPATLRVGRQELTYGEERLIGISNWANTARSWDAARLSLRQGTFRLDAFAASPVILNDGQVDRHQTGNYLHGLYGGLDLPRSGGQTGPRKKPHHIEPYLLWRLNRNVATGSGTFANLNFTALGVRWVGGLPRRFDYGLETVREQGSLGVESVGAWAGYWLLGYSLTESTSSPRVFGEFSYATGDGDPKDGHRQTFDQLFPSGHDKHGLADQVGWKNVVHGGAGLELHPTSKWSITTRFGAFWLADAHDALYNASGTAVVRRADGSAGRFVGSELDGVVAHPINRQFQVGAGIGHLFPGSFLRNTTPGKSYTFPYLMFTANL
jgi:hypothetical protein